MESIRALVRGLQTGGGTNFSLGQLFKAPGLKAFVENNFWYLMPSSRGRKSEAKPGNGTGSKVGSSSEDDLVFKVTTAASASKEKRKTRRAPRETASFTGDFFSSSDEECAGNAAKKRVTRSGTVKQRKSASKPRKAKGQNGQSDDDSSDFMEDVMRLTEVVDGAREPKSRASTSNVQPKTRKFKLSTGKE